MNICGYPVTTLVGADRVLATEYHPMLSQEFHPNNSECLCWRLLDDGCACIFKQKKVKMLTTETTPHTHKPTHTRTHISPLFLKSVGPTCPRSNCLKHMSACVNITSGCSGFGLEGSDYKSVFLLLPPFVTNYSIFCDVCGH